MPEILNTEQRFVDAWWSERIAEAIEALPHTAANAFPEADTGKDFRTAIDQAIEKAGLKDELIEQSAFHHKTENDVNGAGAVFKCKSSEMILIIEAYSDVVLARAWGNDVVGCTKLCDQIIKQVGRKDKPVQREDLIPVAFWHAGAGGEGSCYIKEVQCPAFEDIKGNYGPKVVEDVSWLLGLDTPDALGKIIIWHGPPGNGKTHAVRALAREWSNQIDATVEVVLDPELMLASAGYMRSILLSEERASRARKSIKRRKNGGKEEERPVRLIVIEDSAELFSEGCRNTAGFSRLLNLTDGIIGQGLRCIFLLTANEDIDKIDEAVRRAGRCLQQLEFPKFEKEDAQRWLKENGVTAATKLEYPVSLADLYAVKHGKREPTGTGAGAKFGFGN